MEGEKEKKSNCNCCITAFTGMYIYPLLFSFFSTAVVHDVLGEITHKDRESSEGTHKSAMYIDIKLEHSS